MNDIFVPDLSCAQHAGVSCWQLGVMESGLREARAVRGGMRYAFEPVRLAGDLKVEMRDLRRYPLRLRLPRWVRVSRRTRLPALPPGGSIAGARRRDTELEFVLSAPPVTRRLDLREAIAL